MVTTLSSSCRLALHSTHIHLGPKKCKTIFNEKAYNSYQVSGIQKTLLYKICHPKNLGCSKKKTIFIEHIVLMILKKVYPKRPDHEKIRSNPQTKPKYKFLIYQSCSDRNHTLHRKAT